MLPRPMILLTLALAANAVEYDGFSGYWVTVDATAYTPTDPHDGSYHATKGVDRWMTAGRISDVRKVPNNIAAPFRAGPDRVRNVTMFVDYRTKVLIPKGYGYLDRMRPEDRVFTVDDTGGTITKLTMQSGRVHLDLRFQSRSDAIKWAGPTGKRTIQVFVITGAAVPPPSIPEPATLPAPVTCSSHDPRQILSPEPAPVTEPRTPGMPPNTGWVELQRFASTMLALSLIILGGLCLLPKPTRRMNEGPHDG